MRRVSVSVSVLYDSLLYNVYPAVWNFGQQVCACHWGFNVKHYMFMSSGPTKLSAVVVRGTRHSVRTFTAGLEYSVEHLDHWSQEGAWDRPLMANGMLRARRVLCVFIDRG